MTSGAAAETPLSLYLRPELSGEIAVRTADSRGRKSAPAQAACIRSHDLAEYIDAQTQSTS